MANNPTRRITPAQLRADIESFEALQSIGDYSPTTSAYTVASIRTVKQTMENDQATETQAAVTLDAARDAATNSEWEFHNVINAVKTQVEAQYGPDSDQIQALGRKKKSKYAKPTTRKPSRKDPGQ